MVVRKVKTQLNRFFGGNEKDTVNEVKDLPVDIIVPNPFQPRSVFDEEKIDELCQTIRTHGIIQPIVVRKQDNYYELIAGERRLRAVKKLGLNTIPAIIKDFNDSQSASIALIENLQREGLTAIEEAYAYQRLIEMHNLTQESLAQRLGKGQSTIANKLRLLNLSPLIQEALMKRELTERHARALLSLPNQELQEKVMQEIIAKELNVKQTEEKIKAILTKNDEKKKPTIKSVLPKNTRIALNTIRQSLQMIIKTGISVESEEIDNDDYYEVTIRIPKNK